MVRPDEVEFDGAGSQPVSCEVDGGLGDARPVA